MAMSKAIRIEGEEECERLRMERLQTDDQIPRRLHHVL